jgi:hypothetical protein
LSKAMTKKDYIIVAHAIKDVRNYANQSEWFDEKDREAVRHYQEQLIVRLCQYMLADNPKFDSAKFRQFINKVDVHSVQ